MRLIVSRAPERVMRNDRRQTLNIALPGQGK